MLARIAAETGLPLRAVEATARLLAEGATVPFIARYRKEATGSLDEVAITTIRDRFQQLAELESRRQAILKSLEERQLLSDALRKQIMQAQTMVALEDAFAPFRPRRRTRATMAREKGLEPLAQWLRDHQAATAQELEAQAQGFLVQSEEEDKAVPDQAAALAGARDIIAEWVSDDATARSRMRDFYQEHAVLSSRIMTGKETTPEA
ncbi:MAG: RNA-binding transcriptional accessory protein, partial [Verrucomicrobia bacterium]|nr:RNA-binding transcriptional accessory protein [Verrucomicrobiota bacterium]